MGDLPNTKWLIESGSEVMKVQTTFEDSSNFTAYTTNSGKQYE